MISERSATRSRRLVSSAQVLLAALLLGMVVWPGVKVARASSQSAAAGDEHPASKPYALIFGTVWGPDSRPVYGVRVKIRRADEKKARWELVSNHSGEFAQRVPAGHADYVVWADVKGKEKPQTTVHVQNDERQDIGLHLTE